jgi:8-oxo-dGTP diphosphatase
MKEYVLGFMFDIPAEQVLLIKKAKPDWQAGRLNGVGGKVERYEVPHAAMVREFKEETGVDEENWEETILFYNDMAVVYCFRAFRPIKTLHTARLNTQVSLAEEPCEIYSVKFLPSTVLPNLHWLVPFHACRTTLDEGWFVRSKYLDPSIPCGTYFFVPCAL